MVEDEKTLPNSFISIKFAGIGSVVVENEILENVTPMQVIAIAEYLSVLGKNAMIEQRNQMLEEERRKQQQQQLIIPETRLPNQ